MATQDSIQSSQGEIVSQSEIERLLDMVGESGGAVSESGQSGQSKDPGSDWRDRHDFPQASSFTPSELRKLRMRHEEFVRSLASRLSIYLRMECSIQMSKLETVSFHQFVDALSSPTHLSLLKLEPLRGICLLDMPPHLALSIVDRELGGPAHCMDEARELSKMEISLLSRVVDMLASEWCGVWSDTLDIRPALLRTESSGRFLEIYPPDSTMLIVGMEFRIGDLVEQMQFALPHSMIEPLILKLNSESRNSENPIDSIAQAPAKWNPVFEDVELRVTAEIPGLEISARQLAALIPGDFLQIAPDMVARIQVSLAASPKFVGSLGTSGGKWAVQLAQVLKT